MLSDCSFFGSKSGLCNLQVRVETNSGSYDALQFYKILYNICLFYIFIVMLNKAQIPLMKALLVPFVSPSLRPAFSPSACSLYPLPLYFFPNGDIRVFYLAAIYHVI